jgi:hypothetical protein
MTATSELLRGGSQIAADLRSRMMQSAVDRAARATRWRCIPVLWQHMAPKGWTLMAHEKRGKPVYRYFNPEPADERR